MELIYVNFVIALLSSLTIVLGGIVEGYGYGLSLGTNWPYTKNMLRLALKGDPEVFHRIIATVIGILASISLILDFSILNLLGFLSLIVTAILGMAVLYVLSGKLPPFIQGVHDVFAYSTFLIYLFLSFNLNLNSSINFLSSNVPLFFFYLTIFLGGTVSGARRMKERVGLFIVPKSRLQFFWFLHGVSTLLFLFILAFYIPSYLTTFLLLIAEIAMGGLTYFRLERNPVRPGFVVALHQILSIGVVTSISIHLLM